MIILSNIPYTSTATTLQNQLESDAGNTDLLDSYQTRSNSETATATTTTVIDEPLPNNKSAKTPVGIIVDCVIGVLVLFVAGVVL